MSGFRRGPQSAVFGLLGARVTVLDLAEGQLDADRVAAGHCGYTARVLKPAGQYRVAHCNPATCTIEDLPWDGEGYRITEPCATRKIEDSEEYDVLFRHYLADFFSGLTEVGLPIRGVWDVPFHLRLQPKGAAGWYDHVPFYGQQHFAVVAEKRSI